MARRCYISFKTEDLWYKEEIQKLHGIEYIDNSLNVPINSEDEDYILRRIREDYLSNSTVTLHLIGRYGSENRGAIEQRFIKRELQASLYDGDGNTKNGILGIVLPDMTSSIYAGSWACATCGKTHNYVNINDSTTVREFSYNYYIPHDTCAHAPDDRYCVLAKWDDFVADPSSYVEAAFAKRTAPIAAKTKVKP